VVPVLTSLGLDYAAATCQTVRKDLRPPTVLSVAVHAALLIVMMKIIIVIGTNQISHLTMPHLNDAVSSSMRTFPAIFIDSSWSSASSFAGFGHVALSPVFLYPRQTLQSMTPKNMPG